MIRLPVFLIFLFVIKTVSAGEIQQAEVLHKDGVYILDLKVKLSAPFEPVHAIVTDYDQLHVISEVLIETSLLSEPDAEIKRRRLVVRTCILFFCFTAKMVEDVWETGNTIITRIIPDQSDYKFGETKWQIDLIDDAHSRISLYCELEPDFWIPPVIGPYLMKKTMMREAKKTIRRIEEIANDV
ncbi:MAG: hypothetical protein HN764_13350 [Gammaproteobacteria bacterium]|nr:hypothetical protein [Gammaproteobacteria bacterium]